MHVAEFKAWFAGYTEGMENPPTEKQWRRIKKRVEEIDGTVTTYPVYINRYVNPISHYYPTVYPCMGSVGGVYTNAVGTTLLTNQGVVGAGGSAEFNNGGAGGVGGGGAEFNSLAAFHELGKTESTLN